MLDIGARVLVAEPDPKMAEIMEGLLARQGFEVVVTGEGREALRKILSEAPDAILVDSSLPGVGGLDICRMLKQNKSTRRIPLGFLTGDDEDTKVSTAAQQVGVLLLIPKSFKPQQLVSSVRLLLSARAFQPAA